MKEIYVFKLCEIDDVTDKVRSDLDLIAYLLYEEIISFSYGLSNPVLVQNDSLKYNNIHEFSYDGETRYRLRNDYTSKYGFMYNPVSLGKDCFGITVCSKMIEQDELLKCMRIVQSLIRTDYKFEIQSISYKANSYDDESKRVDAINKYYGYNNGNLGKGHKLTRSKIGSLLTLVGGMGR